MTRLPAGEQIECFAVWDEPGACCMLGTRKHTREHVCRCGHTCLVNMEKPLPRVGSRR